MAFFLQRGRDAREMWPLQRRLSSARSFSFMATAVLIRGRVFQTDMVYSGAYPSRCELGAARPAVGCRIVIRTAGGKKIACVCADDRGIFRATLKPGVYVVTAVDLEVSRRIDVTRFGSPSFDIVRVV